MRALQQCLDQLLVHWRSKLSIMEAGGGRLKKTINIELVKIELIPILTDRNVCIKYGPVESCWKSHKYGINIM